MIRTAANELMSAEADSLCGAGLGEVSDERVDRRCGYRRRTWHTEASMIKLTIPRLRAGSYTPGWLLDDPARAERALVTLVSGSHPPGISVRRVRRSIKEFGISGITRDRAALIAETLNRRAAELGGRPEVAAVAARPQAPQRTRATWRFFVSCVLLGIISVVVLGLLLAPIHAGGLLLIQLVIAGFLCAGLGRWASGRAGETGSAPPGTRRTHFLSW